MKRDDFNIHQFGNPNGPWLIFLHGLLGAAGNWRRITPAFESEYHILTYDQRGHGRSFRPLTGFGPEDFADDLHFLMNDIGIASAFLVGHSMGGRNAFNFASRFPEKVSKLVIEDIGPAPSFENGPGLVKLLRSVPVPFPDKQTAKQYLMNEFGDPYLGSYFYTSITTLPDGRATWNFNLDMVTEIIQKGRMQERWKEIEALKMPTLLLRGEYSEELRVNEFSQMLACNTKIKGVEVKGAGHWIHSDKPEEFIFELKKFLRS